MNLYSLINVLVSVLRKADDNLIWLCFSSLFGMGKRISVIEHTHATTILMLLLERGPLTVTSIMEEGNINRTTFYSTLSVLLKNKLVVEDREEVFPRRRIIKLTEEGRKVAEFLVRIRDILDC